MLEASRLLNSIPNVGVSPTVLVVHRANLFSFPFDPSGI